MFCVALRRRCAALRRNDLTYYPRVGNFSNPRAAPVDLALRGIGLRLNLVHASTRRNSIQ